MTTKPVLYWLYTVCFMIWAMAVIGAVTRLTESGLSITEWKPITGAIPPLNEAEWQAAFTKYQAIPEFKLEHSWMTLADFKKIFFWEWVHRLWGRLIGLVFALPLAYFWLRRKLPPHLKKPLLGLLVLGGLQGVVGWWMVRSGLSVRLDVSHFRLATHLALALVLFSCTLWLALGLRATHKPVTPAIANTFPLGWAALFMLSLTIVWGAFTAGLDAGKIYTTWPLMGGQFTPPETFNGLPDFLNSPAFVQFAHRWLGVGTGILVLIFAAHQRAAWLAVAVLVQIALGIATVLNGVPVTLAALHQANGIVLLGLLLNQLHRLKFR